MIHKLIFIDWAVKKIGHSKDVLKTNTSHLIQTEKNYD